MEKSKIIFEVKNVEVRNCHILRKLFVLTKSTHEKYPLIIQKLTKNIQLKSSHCWRRHDTVQRTACQHGAMVRRLRLKRVGDPLAGGLPLPLPLPEAEGLPGEAEGEGGARLTALPLAADVDRGAGTEGGGGENA